MIKPRKTSVVILITLAELAWLAAFGLLFAYRGKVGELGKTRHELAAATNELAVYRTNAPNMVNLLDQLKSANTNLYALQNRLAVFDKYFNGLSPEEAARRLVAGEAAMQQVIELDSQVKTQLTALAELKKQNEGLLATVNRLRQQLAVAQAGMTNLAGDLKTAEDKQRKWVEGEFAIRRELTGLPDGRLQRVIFLVDTSTSMRNSPSWTSAKNFIRNWLRYLPVEECALVNFNDRATGYPATDYLRVRGPDGKEIPNNRENFLSVFDQAAPGTFTDLLRGLRRAYQYPDADVMVLFTDGHPHVSYQGDASFAADIFKETSKHPKIPILTIALGSYEIENAGGLRPRTNSAISFLKELGRKTGGNFLAR